MASEIEIPESAVEAAARAVERAATTHWTDEQFEVWWNSDPLFCDRRTSWSGYTNMTRKEKAMAEARIALQAVLDPLGCMVPRTVERMLNSIEEQPVFPLEAYDPGDTIVYRIRGQE